MSFELWLSFALATFLMDLSPGPAVTLVIGLTVGKNLKEGLLAAAGLELGELFWCGVAVTAMLLSYRISGVLMDALSWAGAAYLIYLGLKSFIPLPDLLRSRAGRPFPHSSLLTGFTMQLGNPKTYLYWLAFLPQFQPASGPTLAHNLALIAVVVPITLFTSCGYALLAHRAKETLVKDPWKRRLDYLSGGVMICIGAWMILRHLKG